MFGGFDVGGDWSFQVPQDDGIKCYAMISGQSWLSVDGVPDAVRLEAGDCFLLPRGRAFRIASDLALPSVNAYAAFPAELDGSVFSYNGGGDCFGVGGHFDLTGDHAGILLGMLPPIVHIRKQSDSAALRWSVERMMQELRERQPGGYLVAQHQKGDDRRNAPQRARCADSGRSRDRDQTAQFIGLREEGAPLDFD
jgi:hypothetical protein